MEFVQQLLKGRRVNAQEQTAARRAGRAGRLEWREIAELAQRVRGRSWKQMMKEHGDWGRDGTLYIAVRYGRHRLAEVVPSLEGLSYNAAAQAIRRFELVESA